MAGVKTTPSVLPHKSISTSTIDVSLILSLLLIPAHVATTKLGVTIPWFTILPTEITYTELLFNIPTNGNSQDVVVLPLLYIFNL